MPHLLRDDDDGASPFTREVSHFFNKNQFEWGRAILDLSHYIKNGPADDAPHKGGEVAHVFIDDDVPSPLHRGGGRPIDLIDDDVPSILHKGGGPPCSKGTVLLKK